MNQLCFDTDEFGNLIFNTPAAAEKNVDITDKYNEMMAELDEYQAEIVLAPTNTSMCCIAGAGSGKTKTIISRAIKLVHVDKVDPKEIVLITFTNKAANELKERYISFFQEQYPEGAVFDTPHISTIHSFCLSQLRKVFGFNRTILSEYNSYQLFVETCKKIEKKHCLDLPREEVSRLYFQYQALQSSLEILATVFPIFDNKGEFVKIALTRKEIEDAGYNMQILHNMRYSNISALLQGKKPEPANGYNHPTYPFNKPPLRELLQIYLTEKYKTNSLGFVDMDFQYLLAMLHPQHRRYIHNKYKHIVIDEAQDLSPAQYLTGVFTDKESFEFFIEKIKNIPV